MRRFWHFRTKQIIEIARGLGIEVHDHIIVGKDGHASLKALKSGTVAQPGFGNEWSDLLVLRRRRICAEDCSDKVSV